jgi:1-acyl-sn-glycerol-3-phosphate acyltransferase
LAVLYVGGFHVEVRGRRAPRSEAPLLVGAPHSSFLEALAVVYYGCSPVSRAENENAIVISTCQKLAQTIFVER